MEQNPLHPIMHYGQFAKMPQHVTWHLEEVAPPSVRSTKETTGGLDLFKSETDA